MNKLEKSNTINMFRGGLFTFCLLAVLPFFLTSCDNFLNGGDVKQEIEDAIAYNNAKEITVLVQPEEGTGSTVPSGNHKVKQGYDFEVSFSENPAYSFVKWVAVSKDKPQEIIADGISFEDASAPKTKVKVSSDSNSIRIIPFCEQRIAVSGEPSPRYDPLGVSRDRSISVSFTKALSESSFIFAENEIPEGASVKKDESGKIWAYTLNSETFLKNISITNMDDYSIAGNFSKPEVNGKLLTINVDKTNPIEFNAGEIFKTIKVTISADITDSAGIKMNAAKSWNYQITESTDEKATVILTSAAAEGSVYLAGTKAYSLGQKITLAFTENADYQFVRWDYDSSILYIEDPKNINTTALILEKTTEDSPTQIKALCAPRLRVTSFSPVNDSTKPSASKNSSVVLTFNHNLPTDEAGLAQLQNLMITVGGSPVKSSFNAPVIKAATVTFSADESNMLEVAAGQTKTVTVSIPADFYYLLDDGTKVTYGGNGKSFDYKINETTLQQAEITFTASANSGSLTGASGTNTYSLGQELELEFVPANNYQFNGWTITRGAEEVSESEIKILDKSALKTKLIVYKELKGVTVTAKTYLVPVVTSIKPDYNYNGVECDSNIVINFNKAIEDIASVNLASDGIIQIVNPANEFEHYETYFNPPVWSTDKKTVTISAKHTVRNLLANSSDHKNLRVLVNYKLIEDTEGYALQKDPSFVYRINSAMESMEPNVMMSLYKPAGFNLIQNSNGEYQAVENGSYSVLSEDAFDTTKKEFSSNEVYFKNHVGANIYFDANVVDEGSGYRKLTITETLIMTVGGEPVTGATTYETVLTDEEDNFDDALSTTSVHSYKFNSKIDGLIQLKFVFEDWAENTTEKIWYVIKDTTVADNLLTKDNPLSATRLLKSYNARPEKNYTGTDTVYYTVYYYVDGVLTEDDIYLRESDSTGNYTEKIKFSNLDGFYKNKSLKSDYKIEWGYSENNLCNIALKDSNGVYSFTRNVDNVCYVKITCCDAVGNINSTVVKYPKKNRILGLNQNNGNGIPYYNALYSSNKTDGIVLFYKYKNPATGEQSGILYPCNRIKSDSDMMDYYFMFEDYWFSDATKTPDGIYSIYVVPYYKYGDAYYYGVVSEPYVIYHNVDISEEVLQEPAFPADFSYSIDEPAPNSTGIRNISVTLPEDFVPTPNCTYGVTTGLITSKMLDYNFSVNSLATYSLRLAAIDAKGNYYTSDINKTIDATYDNIPPESSINMTYSVRALSAPNEVLLLQGMLPYEKKAGESGLKETTINGNTKKIFNYYYKKYDTNLSNRDLHENANSKVLFNISRNELSQLEKNTVVYNPADKQVRLNFEQTVEGYYFLILELEDKNGNYSIKSGLLSNMVIPKFTKITITGTSTDDYTISSNQSSLPDWNYTLYFGNCYLKDNEWVAVNRVGNGLSRVSEFSFQENYSFIKSSLNGLRNSLYSFYNPEYYIKQNAGETPVCNSKSVIPGLSGRYQVFYDAPCFAHTMAFPTNMLGDLDAKLAEAKSIDSTVDDETYIKAIWETKGREYGLKLINSEWLTNASTSTYTAPVSEIPSGYSYVTVFHFADGTSVMSEVKKK